MKKPNLAELEKMKADLLALRGSQCGFYHEGFDHLNGSFHTPGLPVIDSRPFCDPRIRAREIGCAHEESNRSARGMIYKVLSRLEMRVIPGLSKEYVELILQVLDENMQDLIGPQSKAELCLKHGFNVERNAALLAELAPRIAEKLREHAQLIEELLKLRDEAMKEINSRIEQYNQSWRGRISFILHEYLLFPSFNDFKDED